MNRLPSADVDVRRVVVIGDSRCTAGIDIGVASQVDASPRSRHLSQEDKFAFRLVERRRMKK